MKTHTLRVSRLPGRLLLLVGLLASLALLASRAIPVHAASTLTVTNCSNDSQLQTDVSTANSDNDGDTITFSCGGNADIPLTNSLSISGSMTIDGGQHVTLDGSKEPFNILNVSSGITLTLTALTVANDNSLGGGGGLINNGGTVNIINSTFANNSIFGGAGGGLINDGGTVSITNSTFANNTANSYSGGGGDGGGLWNDLGGTVNIINSTFANNSTNNSGSGGGLYNNSGTVNITNSTFANNTAASGIGGGLYNSGTINITNSTIANNIGTGIYINIVSPVNSRGSIVAGNTVDCYDQYGAIIDNGYNMDGDGLCFGASTSLHGNPQLSALANHGGPTQTMALQQGSPAIDQVPLSANICPGTDQRGDARPDNAENMCDIGAYEFNDVDNDLGLTNMPSNITTNATSPQGTVVTYTSPTVVDEDNPLPAATCTPNSGTTFAIGKTTVTCSVSDSDDTPGSMSKTFTVTVKHVLTLTLPKTMKASEGAVFSGTLATGVAYGTINPLTATISWSDGSSPDVIVVTPNADGSYSVSDSHTFAEEGSYALTVTVADHSHLSMTRTGTVKVGDAALKFTLSSKNISGLTLTQASVFSDADPGGSLLDYSASINWGDGNTTAANTGTNPNGPGFTTQGNHTYTNHGTYTIKLTITDAGGSTVSKSITVTI